MKFNIFITVLVLGFSCGQKKEVNSLVGTWKAQWLDKSGIGNDIPGIECRVMDGTIHFSGDGQVNMRAFGHKGCIFMEDTTTHTMNWALVGDSLKLSENESELPMVYRVISVENDAIECRLIGDIELKLRRN